MGDSLPKTAYFRCDASVEIGGGHLVRCIALADLCQKLGMKVHFICSESEAGTYDEITNLGFVLHKISNSLNESADAKACLDIVADGSLLVVDHYKLGANWEKYFLGQNLIWAIDDIGGREHIAQILHDPSFTIDRVQKFSEMTLNLSTQLFGPEYSLLRSEFSNLVDVPEFEMRSGGLAFFGQGDHDQNARKFLIALSTLDSKFDWTLLLAPQCQHIDEYRKLAKSSKVKLSIGPKNLAEALCHYKIYFGSAGTITWERFACGLPGVVVSVAENQESIAQDLQSNSYLSYFGRVDEIDFAQGIQAAESLSNNENVWTTMSDRAKKLVRPLNEQQCRTILSGEISIRSAKLSDGEFLYQLRTNVAATENSIQKTKFSLNEHLKWLENKLSEEKCMIFILEVDSKEVGQIRIDSNGRVSIGLIEAVRGLGLAKKALARCIEIYRMSVNSDFKFSAEVFKGNASSEKLFIRLGFKLIKITNIENQRDLLLYEL